MAKYPTFVEDRHGVVIVTVEFRQPRWAREANLPFARMASEQVEGLSTYPTAGWLPPTGEEIRCAYFKTRSGKAIGLYPVDDNDDPDLELETRPEVERLYPHSFHLLVPQDVTEDSKSQKWVKNPLSGAHTLIHGEIPPDRWMYFHAGKFLTWHANAKQLTAHEVELLEDEPGNGGDFAHWVVLFGIVDSRPSASEALSVFSAKMRETDADLLALRKQLEQGEITGAEHEEQRAEIMRYRRQLDLARQRCLEEIGGDTDSQPVSVTGEVEIIDDTQVVSATWFKDAVLRNLAAVEEQRRLRATRRIVISDEGQAAGKRRGTKGKSKEASRRRAAEKYGVDYQPAEEFGDDFWEAATKISIEEVVNAADRILPERKQRAVEGLLKVKVQNGSDLVKAHQGGKQNDYKVLRTGLRGLVAEMMAAIQQLHDLCVNMVKERLAPSAEKTSNSAKVSVTPKPGETATSVAMGKAVADRAKRLKVDDIVNACELISQARRDKAVAAFNEAGFRGGKDFFEAKEMDVANVLDGIARKGKAAEAAAFMLAFVKGEHINNKT